MITVGKPNDLNRITVGKLNDLNRITVGKLNDLNIAYCNNSVDIKFIAHEVSLE
jgi:hypothetical protein